MLVSNRANLYSASEGHSEMLPGVGFLVFDRLLVEAVCKVVTKLHMFPTEEVDLLIMFSLMLEGGTSDAMCLVAKFASLPNILFA